MSDRRMIEIDFDLHKRIEAERRSLSEPEYVILRRLLGMKAAAIATVAEPQTRRPGREWFDDGVRLPHGTELRMTYNRRLHQGHIEDGQWLVEGASYSSPSAAAGGVARTKRGEQTNLDGWKYWEVKFPGEKIWKPLSRLRWI
jgi:hypothetical protein